MCKYIFLLAAHMWVWNCGINSADDFCLNEECNPGPYCALSYDDHEPFFIIVPAPCDELMELNE